MNKDSRRLIFSRSVPARMIGAVMILPVLAVFFIGGRNMIAEKNNWGYAIWFIVLILLIYFILTSLRPYQIWASSLGLHQKTLTKNKVTAWVDIIRTEIVLARSSRGSRFSQMDIPNLYLIVRSKDKNGKDSEIRIGVLSAAVPALEKLAEDIDQAARDFKGQSK